MSGEPARRIARELGRRGLAAPARLLLDAHRPLSPLLADAGAAVDPLLRMVGGSSLGDIGALLQDPAGLDRLIGEIEELEERHAEPG
ncbi:MAG: hypothetical protein M3153_00995 [Chloroflexota bacterium]|nr:hypothetical protein [Chloroflexota bacterium]